MKIYEIIEQIKSGDIQAPKRLYVHTYKLLYRIAMQYVSCESLSKDIIQNTYIRIYKKVSEVKFENDAAAISWMRRICVNESLNFIRTKKNWDKLQVSRNNQLVSNNNELRQEEIYNLILSLPIQQRTVFNLFAIEGYSHNEIAKILDITRSNSTTLLARARKYLSNHLIKEMKHESAK